MIAFSRAAKISVTATLAWALAACAGAALQPPPTPSPTRGRIVVTDPFIVAAQYLAYSEFELTSTPSTSDPGFYQTLTFTATLPTRIDSTKDKALYVSLRDAGRPQQKCGDDTPQSGCATIAWADAASRRVFENSITLQLASGARKFHLSESSALTAQAEKSVGPSSALGGAWRAWSARLPDDLVAGSIMQLNLTLTKLGAPNVRLAYEVRVQPVR